MKKRKIVSFFTAIAIAVACIIVPPADKGLDIVAGAATYDNVKTDGGISIKKIVRNNQEIDFAGIIMEGDVITLGIEIPKVDIEVSALMLYIKYNKDYLQLQEWYTNSGRAADKAVTDNVSPALTSTNWIDTWEAFSSRTGASTYDRTNGNIKTEIGASGGPSYDGLMNSKLDLQATFVANSTFSDYGDKNLFELVLTGDEGRTMIFFNDDDDNYVDSQEGSDKAVFVWAPAAINTTINATLTEKECKSSFTVYTTKPGEAADKVKKLSSTDIVLYERDTDGNKLATNDTIDLYSVNSGDYNLGTIYYTKSKVKELENIDTNPFDVTLNPIGGAAIPVEGKHFIFDLKQWCKYANFNISTTGGSPTYSKIVYYDDYYYQTPISISKSGATATGTPDSVYIWLYGDVDHNGSVEAQDATLVLKYIVGIDNSIIGTATDRDDQTNSTYKKTTRQIADVTGDGEVNARDATQILRKVVVLPSVFDTNPKPSV